MLALTVVHENFNKDVVRPLKTWFRIKIIRNLIAWEKSSQRAADFPVEATTTHFLMTRLLHYCLFNSLFLGQICELLCDLILIWIRGITKTL